MILMTFVHAWTRDFAKHKKLARKVFPLWLYVAVTGPIVYWMLKPYYLA
ncbi:MAG: putative membrane protein [Akkermansiaceae bacterium]|jgi:putative membrane protein